MHASRVRLWMLGILLGIYLVGVLLLSAVTFRDPRRGRNSDKAKQADVDADDRAAAGTASGGKGSEYAAAGAGAAASAVRPSNRIRIRWCRQLQFQRPPGQPVALASFPGSGNTWLRYLLQQASGVYTGSVYKDYGLLKSGFPAESVSNGSVLVVKTHEWGAHARTHFAKAVLLVRSPAPAIQAEFNRQSGGHVGFASPERYKKTRGRYWQQFVTDKLKAWKNMNLDWLYNFTGPTHIVFYEQLVDGMQHTLTTLLEFLQVPVTSESLACTLQRREGIYRRKRRILKFDPYTVSMKKRLQIEQKIVYDAIYKMATLARKK